MNTGSKWNTGLINCASCLLTYSYFKVTYKAVPVPSRASNSTVHFWNSFGEQVGSPNQNAHVELLLKDNIPCIICVTPFGITLTLEG
ncbi:hypothetical protein FKM82_011222 [Ascaphus truei]